MAFIRPAADQKIAERPSLAIMQELEKTLHDSEAVFFLEDLTINFKLIEKLKFYANRSPKELEAEIQKPEYTDCYQLMALITFINAFLNIETVDFQLAPNGIEITRIPLKDISTLKKQFSQEPPSELFKELVFPKFKEKFKNALEKKPEATISLTPKQPDDSKNLSQLLTDLKCTLPKPITKHNSQIILTVFIEEMFFIQKQLKEIITQAKTILAIKHLPLSGLVTETFAKVTANPPPATPKNDLFRDNLFFDQTHSTPSSPRDTSTPKDCSLPQDHSFNLLRADIPSQPDNIIQSRPPSPLPT